MPKYNPMTPQVQAIKRRIAAVLHADDERATIGAIADYLGVFRRALMSKTHDPHTIENSHIVSASTLQPPGYTPAELVLYNFNPGSRVWHPGQDFKVHMDARLQQMFPALGGNLQTPGTASIPALASVGPAGLPAGCSKHPGTVPIATPVANPGSLIRTSPGLVALLEPVVYLNLGANYPTSGVRSLAAAGPLYRSGAVIIDLYMHVYNYPMDNPKLADWIRAHIPQADQPEFVGSWKQATRQVKAAQVGWEAVGHRGEELPPVPEVGMGRKRNEQETTDPGIVAIGVAHDKADGLRAIAIEARAAAILDPQLNSEFVVALLGFNLALVELWVAWEAKWRARKI